MPGNARGSLTRYIKVALTTLSSIARLRPWVSALVSHVGSMGSTLWSTNSAGLSRRHRYGCTREGNAGLDRMRAMLTVSFLKRQRHVNCRMVSGDGD